MRVTLQQVEELRKRVNCDYQTAEKALRKSKGNIDDAVLYLKKSENKRYKKVIVTIQEIVSKIVSYNIVVYKNDRKLGNLPIVIIVLGIWALDIPLPIVLAVGVLAALSEFSFELVDRSDENTDENVFKTTKEAVKDTEKHTTTEEKEAQGDVEVHTKKSSGRKGSIEENHVDEVEEPEYDDDEYNEIIIE